MRWPTGTIVLHGLADKVKYAQLLCDGSRIQTVKADNPDSQNPNPRIPSDAVGLRLMTAPENMPIPVIELFLK
jgi:alpha-L-fucosidase